MKATKHLSKTNDNSGHLLFVLTNEKGGMPMC